MNSPKHPVAAALEPQRSSYKNGRMHVRETESEVEVKITCAAKRSLVLYSSGAA